MGFFGGLLRRNVPREPVDPFAPDPYAALGSRDLPPHSPPWKQPHPHSWAAWLASFPPSPSKAIHAVLRALDVVVGDAGGKILPVVNEGFVKTPYSKSKGDVEEAIRVPVRKTVKDGIVRWRPHTSLLGLPPFLVSHRTPRPYLVLNDQVGSLPLLDSHSPFIMKWDVITLFLLIWTSILTPFEVAFITSEQIDILFLLNRIVDLSFLFDILLQFCTAYHDPSTDSLVRSHPKIAKHYLSTWFSIDLVSTIPFELLVFFIPHQGDSWEFLRLLRVLRLTRLLKLLRVLRANRKMKQLEQEGADWLRSGIVTGIKYAFILLIVSHWFGCAYTFISEGHFHPDEGPGWVSALPKDTPLHIKYLMSFYYGASTLSLGGFNAHPSLYPRAEREFALTGILSLAGLGVLLYLLPSLSARASVVQKEQLEHEHLLAKYADMLSTLGVRKDKYGARVVGYWEERRSVEHIARFDTLLRNLPDSTRALISIDLFAHLVASLPYISPFIATDLSMIVELASAIRIRVWSPNQLLWESGGCDGVYFLQKGVVGLDGRVYLRGDTIGSECLRNKSPNRDARCLTFVTAHYLPKDALQAAVSKRPWVEDVAKEWTAWKVFQIYVKVYTKLYFRMCKRGARAKPRPRLSRRGVFANPVPTPGTPGMGTSPLHSQNLAPASVWSSNASFQNLTPLKEDEWDDIDEMVLEYIHINHF